MQEEILLINLFLGYEQTPRMHRIGGKKDPQICKVFSAASLDTLRLKTFTDKVGKQVVKPKTLPQTTDRARQYYYMVYDQIQD